MRYINSSQDEFSGSSRINLIARDLTEDLDVVVAGVIGKAVWHSALANGVCGDYMPGWMIVAPDSSSISTVRKFPGAGGIE